MHALTGNTATASAQREPQSCLHLRACRVNLCRSYAVVVDKNFFEALLRPEEQAQKLNRGAWTPLPCCQTLCWKGGRAPPRRRTEGQFGQARLLARVRARACARALSVSICAGDSCPRIACCLFDSFRKISDFGKCRVVTTKEKTTSKARPCFQMRLHRVARDLLLSRCALCLQAGAPQLSRPHAPAAGGLHL